MNQQHSWSQYRSDADLICARVAALIRDHGVMVRYLGRPLLGYSSAQLIALVARTVPVEQEPVSIPRLSGIVQALWQLRDEGLVPCRLDVGLLSNTLGTDQQMVEQLRALPGLLDPQSSGAQPKLRPVVLFGFGRIGRIMARLLMERHGPGSPLELSAIVLRPAKIDNDLEKRASLLERDSVHGPFDGQVEVDRDNQCLVINGHAVKIIYANAPEDIDYSAYGLRDPLIVDNTGAFKDREGLGRHLGGTGARQVLLTAPAKGDIANVVYGINDQTVGPDTAISSAASCTTNAAAPVLAVMDQQFGVVSGHLETIHAFTNDQNLIDNFHKADRRGRAAPLNLVITSTGAAKAVAKVLPALDGKLTGNAIRVPTPNVSLVILNLELARASSVEEINRVLLQESRNGAYAKQIGFTNEPEVVSSDFVGTRTTSIIDAQATLAQRNKVVLYIWYDNEFGYTHQVLRLAAKLSGQDLPSLPQI